MKNLIVVLLIALFSISSAGEKKKDKEPAKFTYRAEELKKLEAAAKEVMSEKEKAQKFIAEMDQKMLVLQGQYSYAMQMPDSFIARIDSTVKK